MIKLLIVDDSALVRKLLGRIFSAEPDFAPRFARSGAEALAEIAREKPDVVTLDIHMPEMDGLACLDRIMIENPCPVVMVSSADGAELTFEALRRGAVDFVPKPGRAISLGIDAMSAQLVEKVRNAVSAKLRGSLRLRERVRHRMGPGWPAGVARPAPAAAAATMPPHGLVVAATSTGGPPALEALLTPLPADFPWPIVVAQHMPAAFTGALARRLDQLCALTIVEVTAPVSLAPGFVYIAHGDADIIVERQAEGLMARPAVALASYPWHPSADRLVRSAMEAVAPEQLLGVLMTGMGNDGAAAMAALHGAGGRTIAESEETAVVWGMPGELVKAGGADHVLPLGEIAARLQRLLG